MSKSKDSSLSIITWLSLTSVLESGDMSTLDFFALFPSYLLPLDFPGVVIFLNIDLIEGL